jgi:hypothetical protein
LTPNFFFFSDPIAQLIFSDFFLLLFLHVNADDYVDALTLEAIEEDYYASLVLKNDSKALEKWIHSPNKILKIHIFNYTNIDRFIKGLDDKIRVKDIGPYVYSETSDKVQLAFTDDHKIVYHENRTQFFERELSGKLKEGDIFMVPNVALLTAIGEAAGSSIIKRF